MNAVTLWRPFLPPHSFSQSAAKLRQWAKCANEINTECEWKNPLRPNRSEEEKANKLQNKIRLRCPHSMARESGVDFTAAAESMTKEKNITSRIVLPSDCRSVGRRDFVWEWCSLVSIARCVRIIHIFRAQDNVVGRLQRSDRFIRCACICNEKWCTRKIFAPVALVGIYDVLQITRPKRQL